MTDTVDRDGGHIGRPRVLRRHSTRVRHALAPFTRLKKQYASVLAEQEQMEVRHRNSGFGRKPRYAVRVGFESLAEAQKLCDRLRARGGACGVAKN